MAINLICPECKSNLSLRARICKNCGYYFSNGKKYRVVVKDQNGRRISKVLNSVAIAKKLERKLKMIDHIGCGGKLTRDKTEWSKHFRGEVYPIHILFWITSGLSGRARLPEDD
jgi:predicted amidophosphoribosyltransferase